MVKPDVKVNYYAALELPNTATDDEIKTAYRKLALRYHPDRNPGKEEEFISKFQAIQAAQEVLGDASTKAKYDADRRRAGLYPASGGGGGGGSAPTRANTSSAARGNPYSAPNTAWPPPPRRTNDPTAWAKNNPRASQNMPQGADRFANFPRPSPTSKRDSDQERTNQYTGWQNMNNNYGRRPQAPGQSQAPPPKPAPPPRSSRPAPPPRNDTRFPSEEQIRAGMKYKQPPSSFAPNEQRTSWAQTPPSADAFGRPPMSRTASMRTPRKGFDPNAPGSDERPAGISSNYTTRPVPPPPPPPFPPPPPNQPPTGSNIFGQPQPTSPNMQFDVPYAEAKRERTPYASHVNEKTYFSSEQLKRSQSTRDTTKMNTEPTTHSSQHNRHRSASPLKPGEANGTKNKPFTVGSSSESSDDDFESGATSPEMSEQQQGRTGKDDTNPFLRAQSRPKMTPTPPSRRANITPNAQKRTSNTPAGNGESEQSKPSIFSMPVSDDTFQPTSHTKTRSEENINTAFSASQWSGQFTGNSAENIFAAPSPSTRKPSPLKRGRDTLSARSSKAQMNGPRSAQMAPPPLSTANAMPSNEPASAPADGKFTADEWRDSPWNFHPAHSPASNNRRPQSRRASTTAAKTLSTAQNANPTTQESSADKPVDAVPAVDAMDIDPATPPAPKQSSPKDTKGPRLYAVPPSTWRQSQGAPSAPPMAAQQQQQQQRRQSSAAVNAAAETGGVDLNELARTLSGPSASTAGRNGFDGMRDMTSTLPFKSQPSTTHPTRSFAPDLTPLPPVPRGPELPTKLTKHSWSSYVASFSNYLAAFHLFNKDMHVHFRESLMHESKFVMLCPQSLEAVGQAGDVGLKSYAKTVREDERFRELWGVAHEKHKIAVEQFEGVKERVRKITTDGGGLSDI